MNPSRRSIPGPAGRIAKLLRERPGVNLNADENIPVKSIQEYLTEALGSDTVGGLDNSCFMKKNWLDAQSFPSSTLFTWMTEFEAGVTPTQISQITPSGPKKIDLNPTGVVRATMHHTAVWQQSRYEQLKVGTVLVLQKV
ncbi:unnamed protein product [Rhodiola kirilowii]